VSGPRWGRRPSSRSNLKALPGPGDLVPGHHDDHGAWSTAQGRGRRLGMTHPHPALTTCARSHAARARTARAPRSHARPGYRTGDSRSDLPCLYCAHPKSGGGLERREGSWRNRSSKAVHRQADRQILHGRCVLLQALPGAGCCPPAARATQVTSSCVRASNRWSGRPRGVAGWPRAGRPRAALAACYRLASDGQPHRRQ